MLEGIRNGERAELAAFDLSSVYAALGDRDTALELLEQSYAAHDPNLVLLKVWPLFDPIREDERYRDLVRRMRFPS